MVAYFVLVDLMTLTVTFDLYVTKTDRDRGTWEN